MSRWRPALRIARRTVRRSLGRSLLIAVLVGLPVAGATFVDVLIRTFSNDARSTYEQIGPADAGLTITGRSTLVGYAPMPYLGDPGQPSGHRRSPQDVDLAAVLPAGSTWTPVPNHYQVRLSLGQDRIIRPQLTVVDLSSPLTPQVARLTQGRLASAADEVVLTEPLAERIGLLDGSGHLIDGASVTMADGPTATVTGTVIDPFCLDCEDVIAAPDSPISVAVEREAGYVNDVKYSYLVDLPAGTDADALWPTLARKGIAMVPRDAFLHPDRYSGMGSNSRLPAITAASVRAAAFALLVTGLGLLEVILLAGTAFAVGARRQVHDLGVISASGATSRQIRRIVLAQGLVLGVLGSALGIVFGALVAWGGRALWERLDNAVVFAWKFGPWEILVAAIVGAVSGVLAAVVPAIGAGRMPVVDALSGRFRVSVASKRRTPVVAGLLIAAGVACGLVGDRMMAGDFARYVRQLARVDATSGYVSPPSPNVPVAFVLLGAVLVVIGVVMLAPVLITTIGRMAARLPLSGRLAFRDASRHRHRTGPATSAIAVAVAGSVVFAFVLAGRAKADQLSYVAYLPPQVMSVSGMDYPGDEEQLAMASGEAAALLPGGSAVPVDHLTAGTSSKRRDTQEIYVEQSRRQCRNGCMTQMVGVANPDVMTLTLGRSPTDDELAQLAAGKVLVVSSKLVTKQGQVRLQVGRRVELLPAVNAQAENIFGNLPGAFVSADTVDERGWGTVVPEFLVPFEGSATQNQIDDALTAVEQHDGYGAIDTGPSDPSRILLIIAGIAAAFVTLVGVAISVALSAAEGRADLATLAAVGAPPRRRRSLAAAQAFLVGGLGCGIGLLLGVFVSYTLRSTIGAPTFIVPWNNLLVVGLVVPLVAVLIAAVFTPSRLPLTVRRSW